MLNTNYVAGSPNWIDLGSADIEASAAFYTNLFGWEFQSAGPDAGGYGFLVLGGKTVAALGPLTEEGARPSWTVYFNTPNAVDTAKAVQGGGGTVRLQPMDVFTAGRMAGFSDPAGAQFAVWQPGDTKGLEQVNVPNSLAWTELYTTDADAAKRFYGDVFGWRTDDTDMGGGMVYTVVSPATGGDDASQGGIMQISPEMATGGVTPHWGVYFEVADCDATVAKAVELGGSVLMGPQTMAGVGRFAQLSDAQGALFSVIASVTP
jgi:predicted enzyme related to lactoylglutathione lyase